MTRQFPFINREYELAHVHTLLEQWGSNMVLCIDAPAGIGKTRLLHEIRQRYIRHASDYPQVHITDSIDFDNQSLHLRQSVGLRIAQILNTRSFTLYLQALQDWRRMSLAGVSSWRLTQQAAEIHRAFLECFRMFAAEKRVVLFLDSTDIIAETDVQDYLLDLLPQLPNTLTLLAGRNARKLGTHLQATMGEQVEILELPSLLTWTGEADLQHKEEVLRDKIAMELAQKLLLLARGQPIFLDFAIPSRADALGITWLRETPLDVIQALPYPQLQQWRRRFVLELVQYFTDTSPLLDWVILVMASIYPLDNVMIARLLAISEERAADLFDEAKAYIFVKQLPNERIALHDEMRRMVNEHVWPEIDPTGDRQRRDSKLAVEYLEHEIAVLTRHRKELLAERQRSHDAEQTPEAISTFLQPDLLERRLWELKEQLLSHVLFVDVERGVNTFTTFFEEATYAYHFAIRQALLQQMQHYFHRLSPLQRYEVDSRRIKQLADEGKYLQAGLLTTEILEMHDLLPEQQVEMLIQRGSAEVRSGHLHQSIADFERAIAICHQYRLPHSLVRALNARGWSYRHHGDFDQALTDYLEAYQRSVELDDMHQTAWILNNMGFANAFIGNLQQAFDNCWTALALWEELDFARGIGATYSTLGEIYRRSDQLSEAINAYSNALDILTSENDVEWISIVRCGRASILWVQGELEQSEEDLRWAWEHGPQSLKSSILFYEAQLAWVKGDLEKAAQKLEACSKVCREIGDQFFDYASFSAFLDLAWAIGVTHHWQDYAEEHRQRYAGRHGLVALRQRGSCLRKIGDMALCNGDYATALEAYKEGLPLITRYEVSRPYTIGDQLKKTRNRILTHASTEALRQLGRDLYLFWREQQELINRHPEALLTFRRWESMGQPAGDAADADASS